MQSVMNRVRGRTANGTPIGQRATSAAAMSRMIGAMAARESPRNSGASTRRRAR